MVATAIFEFSFVMPIHQSHFFSLSAQDSSFQKVISSFFVRSASSRFSITKKSFFLKKSNLLFADGSFPLCRPVARASNVLHDVMLAKVVFYQRPTRVLPIPRPLFCLSIRQCSLSGFCPNKNDVGPLLVLPAESVIWSIALDLDNQPTSVTVFSWMVESTATVRNLMHVDDHRFDQVLIKSRQN